MSRYGETCWMEIPVTNAKRAIRFYRDVFQWNIHDEGYDKQVEGVERVHFFNKGNFRGSFQLVPEDQFFNMSEAFAGALSRESNGSRKEQQRGPLLGVTSSFAVEDMDETLKRIVDGGGRIFQDKQILGRGMGSIAKFVDTEGNVFALFSYHIWDSD